MRKPNIEYRIVCPNFGTTGHKTHVARKRAQTLEEAKERAERQDAHYRRLTETYSGYSYYRSEIGWKVQTRTITEWEDVDET